MQKHIWVQRYEKKYIYARKVHFLEKECLFGTDKKAEGLKGIKQTKVAASSTAVTADELIDLQELIPDRYQANAYWIMSKNTRTAIRKLKDGQGNYLLVRDHLREFMVMVDGKTAENATRSGLIQAFIAHEADDRRRGVEYFLDQCRIYIVDDGVCARDFAEWREGAE